MFFEQKSHLDLIMIALIINSYAILGLVDPDSYCLENLQIQKLKCLCSSEATNHTTIEYLINCERPSNTPSESTLIGVIASGTNQPSAIRSIEISNQQIETLEIDKLVESTLKIFELRLINDSIKFVSSAVDLSNSNVIDLETLVITQNTIEMIDLVFTRQLVKLKTLDLTRNKISSIGLQIDQKSGLNKIYLDQNSLTTFDSFSDFPDLIAIRLSHNTLNKITTNMFTNLTRLRVLDLSFNLITRIESKSFSSLVCLENLYLNNNNLKLIDSSLFARLFRLEILEIHDNKLAEIKSRTFVSLLALKRLDLSYQKIAAIELDAIVNCTSLTDLILDGNQLTTITSGFYRGLARLSDLYFSNNLIAELRSDTFDHSMPFGQLEWLILQNNLIKSIQPGVFARVGYSLEILSLVKNNLRSLEPETFVGLDNLGQLFLNENKLNTIKANLFSHVSSLKTLDLKDNFIAEIEPFAFSQLDKLESLDLSVNQLSKLSPLMFTGLSNLSYLSLTTNKIESIGDNSFATLTSLILLDLNENRIKSIVGSDVFNGLQNTLESISLCDNRLENIDGAFENFTKLANIELASNQIRRIDERTFSVGNHPSLALQLDLSQNPLDEYVDRKLFDSLAPQLTALYLSRIGSNPSDFLVFSSSAFTTLFNLDVSQTRFRVEANTFDAIAPSIQNLVLRQIGLTNLVHLRMERMISLTTIDLSDNPLDWSVFNASCTFFRTHPDIQKVYLSNTSLRDIDSLGISHFRWISETDGLSELDLSNNLIELVAENQFTFLNNSFEFLNLKLSNNRIKLIQFNSFYWIRKLHVLELDGNLLADQIQVENMNCRRLPSMTQLNLSGSQLTRLPLFDLDWKTLTNVPDSIDGYALDRIQLAHNRIESMGREHFSKLTQISFIDLSFNRIWMIPTTDVFSNTPKLAHLNLSSNLINTTGLGRINFNLCTNLVQLNLSHNRIRYVQSYVFQALNKLEKIDLSYNQIYEIDSYAFRWLPRLRELFLYDFGSSISLRDKFLSDCDSLKLVHVSSVEMIRTNLNALSSSLTAVAANKTVNEAVYFNSINLKLENFDYYESNVRLACLLTIELLKRRIHMNLYDDFDVVVFFKNCQTLDFDSDIVV